MSKTLTVDEITAKFRIKKLTRIEVEPTYEAISRLSQELYTNAATLARPLGGGQHGHIGMVMKPSLYESLSNIPYVTPKNPGPTPKFDDAKTLGIIKKIMNGFVTPPVKNTKKDNCKISIVKKIKAALSEICDFL